MTAAGHAAAAIPASPIDKRVRFDRLDALRGFAVVWMAAFHFAFDLNQREPDHGAVV